MNAYEIYYEAPGCQGSDVIVCHEEDLESTLEEKLGYKIDRIKYTKKQISLAKVRIRDLDARSFLNLLQEMK